MNQLKSPFGEGYSINMRSKREIIGDVLTKNKIVRYIDTFKKCMGESADEYAKETAIGFAKWMSKHRLDFQPIKNDGSWIGLDMITYSSEELYELYIKTEK